MQRNVPPDCMFMAGGTADYSTVQMQKLSPSLRSALPLTKEDAAMWVHYWRMKDLLI